MQKTDLNADMGEGIGNDAALMPYISSANISCGYHAGDEDDIRNAINLALQYGVNVGAHISYLDKEHFGRIEQQLDDVALYDLVSDQLFLFSELAKAEGAQVVHVKPHGALYNLSAKNKQVAHVIARAIFDFDSTLTLFGLSGSVSVIAAMEVNLNCKNEAFADRRYLPGGSLMPRSDKGSVIHEPDEVFSQVQQIVCHQRVVSSGGEEVPMRAETICVHGDHKNVLVYAQRIYTYLNTTE